MKVSFSKTPSFPLDSYLDYKLNHLKIIKVAACSPPLFLADPAQNGTIIIQEIEKASSHQAQMIVFPELAITGASCGDLFKQQLLLEKSWQTFLTIVEATKHLPIISVIGLPLQIHHRLYNAAGVMYQGKILGFVLKTNLGNQAGTEESRYFHPGTINTSMTILSQTIPVAGQLLFQDSTLPALCFGVEIGQDLYAPFPPSQALCQQGATLIVNPSAQPFIDPHSRNKLDYLTHYSRKTNCAYVYAEANFEESTTNYVFAGQSLIFEKGILQAQAPLFTPTTIYGDIDLEQINQSRIDNWLRMDSFPPTSPTPPSIAFDFQTAPIQQAKQIQLGKPMEQVESIEISLPQLLTAIEKPILSHPFFPAASPSSSTSISNETYSFSQNILHVQAHGLMQRLKKSKATSAVLGLSGGLDSTLALLVTVKAFQLLNWPLKNLYAISLSGFGTTSRTYSNARALTDIFQTSWQDISITSAVLQHFEDIQHDPTLHNATYENAQARERTQILMDIANKYNGLVVGTGDLSELALGWATYNGDHMSMYGVNASLPKTLIQFLIKQMATHPQLIMDSQATEKEHQALGIILHDILKTPVSPELLPPCEDQIQQKTEDLVGPYELHDFFLYHLIKMGLPPPKVFIYACLAFQAKYSPEIILKWLKIFIKRFFAHQFKRSCMPDGPQAHILSLSPRGAWSMPSDGSATLWIDSLKIFS